MNYTNHITSQLRSFAIDDFEINNLLFKLNEIFVPIWKYELTQRNIFKDMDSKVYHISVEDRNIKLLLIQKDNDYVFDLESIKAVNANVTHYPENLVDLMTKWFVKYNLKDFNELHHSYDRLLRKVWLYDPGSAGDDAMKAVFYSLQNKNVPFDILDIMAEDITNNYGIGNLSKFIQKYTFNSNVSSIGMENDQMAEEEISYGNPKTIKNLNLNINDDISSNYECRNSPLKSFVDDYGETAERNEPYSEDSPPFVNSYSDSQMNLQFSLEHDNPSPGMSQDFYQTTENTPLSKRPKGKIMEMIEKCNKEEEPIEPPQKKSKITFETMEEKKFEKLHASILEVLLKRNEKLFKMDEDVAGLLKTKFEDINKRIKFKLNVDTTKFNLVNPWKLAQKMDYPESVKRQSLSFTIPSIASHSKSITDERFIKPEDFANYIEACNKVPFSEVEFFTRLKKKKASLGIFKEFCDKNIIHLEYITAVTEERKRNVIYINKAASFHLYDFISYLANSVYNGDSLFYTFKEFYKSNTYKNYVILDVSFGSKPVYIVTNPRCNKVVVISMWDLLSGKEEFKTFKYVEYITGHHELSGVPLISFFQYDDISTVFSCLDMMVAFKLCHLPLEKWQKSIKNVDMQRPNITKICEKNSEICKDFVHKKRELNSLYSFKVKFSK